MRISINEILVIVIIVLVLMILRNPDSVRNNPLHRALVSMARAHQKEEEARALAGKERRRRNTSCRFRDGFGASEFEWMVQRAGRYLPWVAQLEVSGPVVSGVITASNGEPEGDFTLDFNDYGHVTGKYWLTKTVTSNQPERFAVCIIHELDEWKAGTGREAYEQERRFRRRARMKKVFPAVMAAVLLLAVLIGGILHAMA